MKLSIRSFVFATGLSVVTAVSARAAAPPTETGPDHPNPPGTFPLTLTATNVNVSSKPGSVFGGDGSNDLKVSFPSSGPIKWTSSRYNEGDLAISIGPFDPADPSYYPPDAFGEFKPGRDGQPFHNSTMAWRITKTTGATLVTVRTNGYTPDITFNGQPVGTLHGSAYAFTQGSQGYGYRTNDGIWDNGGNDSLDVVMGVAGYDELQGESAFDIASAYFPYEEGWKGAWVEAGAGAPEGTINVAHPDFIGSTVATWQEDSVGSGIYTLGNGRVVLPGVNSATDGMLFVAPSSDTSNGTHIAAGAPRDGGWDVTVRQDQGDGLGAFPINLVGSSPYQFLYVPFDADGLIGGLVDGETGSVVEGAGEAKFTLERLEAGEYALSVFAGAEELTGDDGMLILSVASHDSTVAEGNVAARTMLSYEYDAAAGDFIIQSRIDAAIEGGTSIFGDLLELTDTNFYFAWVDFTNPMSPLPGTPNVTGDTDGDGDVDLDDLNNVRNNFGASGGSAVPEPSAWLLGLLGAAGVAAVRRMRKS